MTNRRKFLRQASYGSLGLGIISLLPYCKTSTNTDVEKGFSALPRSTPEQQGISSSAISNLLEAIKNSGQEFHGLIIVRNGQVITEGYWSPFQKGMKHTLYSLSKSFTSSAIGMLVDDGKLSVEDLVVDLFKEDLPPEVSPNLSAMNVKHLLTMNTGHSTKPLYAMLKAEDGNWPKAFLAQEVTHIPGSHFLYNTGATYMLSAIVQKITGQSTEEFLQTRLFEPLNIKDKDWELDPNGISVGGYGLRVSTEAIANFGQLYLQKGKWEDQQLLSENWVEEATKMQTTSQEGDNDWSQGYGYQFWRCKPEPGFYRGDGAFGQFCIVIPQKNTVIAINSESVDMQASMDLIWDNLLPALGDEKSLPSDKVAHEKLETSLSTLSIPTQKGLSGSPIISEISGKLFDFYDNNLNLYTMTFTFKDDQCQVKVQGKNGVENLTSGNGYWVSDSNEKKHPDGLFAIEGKTNVLSKVAAYHNWVDEKTLVFNLKFIENIHSDQWTCHFVKNTVRISFLDSKSIFDAEQESREEVIGAY